MDTIKKGWKALRMPKSPEGMLLMMNSISLLKNAFFLFSVARVGTCFAVPPSPAADSSFGGFLSPRDIAFGNRNLKEDTPYGFSISNTQRSWTDAREKAKQLVSGLTVQEKLNLTSGLGHDPSTLCSGTSGALPRVGIREICYNDGPIGPRPPEGVTAPPVGVTTAVTWDKDLIYQRAVAIGKEFLGKGVDIALGPVTGGPLGRSAWGGRNWEGFSPDPYLTGVASYLGTIGLQKTGVIASAKHYIAYEQETYRNPVRANSSTQDINVVSVDSIVDDRTLHELYLWPFVEAIRAGTGTIMCSYNRINGEYGCQSNATLMKILRDELNFPGYVVSDWGGTHQTIPTALGGLDVEMPGAGNTSIPGASSGFLGQNLLKAIQNGSVPMSRLDEMATNVLTTYFKFGHDDSSFPSPNFNTSSLAGPGNQQVNVQEDHAILARQVATDGIVLLKNSNNTLPLKSPKSIAVFGTDAGQAPAGPWGCSSYNSGSGSCTANSTNNGTNFCGGGSGWIRPPYLVDPLSALQNRIRQDKTWLTYFLEDDPSIGNNAEEIAQFSSIAETCLVFVQSRAAEGHDRFISDIQSNSNLTLWGHGNELIKLVAENCGSTVVVMHNPGQVDMSEWIENENVTAILDAGLPGQEMGNAITDVIYGDVNPSGKLVYTIAKDVNDYIRIDSTPSKAPTSNFTEGNAIDYMLFDRENKDVLFEFGFGLSYTTFSYSSISITSTSGSGSYSPTTFPNPSTSKIGGDPKDFEYIYEVKAKIINDGKTKGREVVQLYLGFPENSGMPPKVLRGFEKTPLLSPSKSTQVTFPLRRKDFSIWNSEEKKWEVPKGKFEIMICKSSRKCELKKEVEVRG